MSLSGMVSFWWRRAREEAASESLKRPSEHHNPTRLRGLSRCGGARGGAVRGRGAARGNGIIRRLRRVSRRPDAHVAVALAPPRSHSSSLVHLPALLAARARADRRHARDHRVAAPAARPRRWRRPRTRRPPPCFATTSGNSTTSSRPARSPRPNATPRWPISSPASGRSWRNPRPSRQPTSERPRFIVALVLVALVPVTAGGLYVLLGDPAAIDATPARQEAAVSDPQVHRDGRQPRAEVEGQSGGRRRLGDARTLVPRARSLRSRGAGVRRGREAPAAERRAPHRLGRGRRAGAGTQPRGRADAAPQSRAGDRSHVHEGAGAERRGRGRAQRAAGRDLVLEATEGATARRGPPKRRRSTR